MINNVVLRVYLSLLLLILASSQLQLNQVSGTVVVDVVTGVHGRSSGLVVVDWNAAAGHGGHGGGARRGGALHSVDQRRVVVVGS